MSAISSMHSMVIRVESMSIATSLNSLILWLADRVGGVQLCRLGCHFDGLAQRGREGDAFAAHGAVAQPGQVGRRGQCGDAFKAGLAVVQPCRTRFMGVVMVSWVSAGRWSGFRSAA
jgi:hypothetical protein